MELISWSLNAIDTIFSTRKSGAGEPSCPDGTFPAGYVVDSWGTWRTACMAPFSIEDIEDVYLFGFMIAGGLLLALSTGLIYRQINITAAAKIGAPRLSVRIMEMVKAVGYQNNILEKLTALQGEMGKAVSYQNIRVDNIMEKLTALQGEMNIQRTMLSDIRVE